MKIVLPKAEILPRMAPLEKIELCGRVCYKSEDKITEDSAERFVKKLIERGHTSVLEHARVVVPAEVFPGYYHGPKGRNTTYGFFGRISYRRPATTVETDYRPFSRLINSRDFIAMGGTLEELKTLEEADDYMSVRFICDRAIANELVRHRVFSFSQLSSRYVSYKDGVDFILPLPFDWAAAVYPSAGIRPAAEDPRYMAWRQSCAYAERAYIQMLEYGVTPEAARTVLPLSTSTELIMTGTYVQWRQMLKLRMASAAHPQMRYLMRLLVDLPEFPKEQIILEEK